MDNAGDSTHVALEIANIDVSIDSDRNPAEEEEPKNARG